MIPFVRETENSVFVLLPLPRYVGRALIDEAWSRRRSERRPFVRGPRSLFRQVARNKRRGKGRSLADHAMTSDRKVRNCLRGRGRCWPGRKKKSSKFRGKWRYGENVRSGFYRTFAYIFCSIRFMVFSIFLLFFFFGKVYLKNEFLIGVRI